MHPATPAPDPTPRDLRHFALTVGAAFVTLAALAYWRGRHGTSIVFGTFGVGLGAAGLLAPARLGPAYRGWMALAVAISKVTTPVFVGVVYFAIFTPLGLAMRLLGRRPLERARGAATFWADRPEGARRSDLRRQF
jgi:hypothetical protein